MFTIFQVLIAMIAVMAIISASTLTLAFQEKRVFERGLALVASGSAGFIAFSLVFLSDPWVQEGIQSELTRWFL